MSHLRWGLLLILLLGVGYNNLIASENDSNNVNNDTDSENEEICDQELFYITSNYGDKFYILCLETNEDNRRITGIRYNTYHEKTREFIKSKVYNEDDLGFNDCIHASSNEPHQEPLTNQNPSSNNTSQNHLSKLNSKNTNNTLSTDCISSQTTNIGSFDVLYFQTSHFSVYQGGDLYFSYLSSPFDSSYESLGLRLSKQNDRWTLTDLNNQRVRALNFDLNKPWYLINKFPSGINSILPIYEERERPEKLEDIMIKQEPKIMVENQ